MEKPRQEKGLSQDHTVSGISLFPAHPVPPGLQSLYELVYVGTSPGGVKWKIVWSGRQEMARRGHMGQGEPLLGLVKSTSLQAANL